MIPSLFFFFSFCEVQLCFAPIQFQLLKSVTRILASSFFFFHEDERFNDLRWNFISLLRRTVNQILRGHRSLLGGFAICQNVPLSIHKDDQPQLSRPRVVNHDTRENRQFQRGCPCTRRVYKPSSLNISFLLPSTRSCEVLARGRDRLTGVEAL